MRSLTSKGAVRRALFVAILAVALPATAQSPFLSSIAASIAISTSLSASIDLKDQPIVAIQMPTGWDAAQLTFQGSNNNSTFQNVYNMFGEEFTVEAAASRYIVLSPFEFQWARYIKIRSGTSGTPVTQTAARSFVLVTRKVQ